MTRWSTKKPKTINRDLLSIFDQPEKGEIAKQHGINTAYAHADTIWKSAAADALRECALKYREFTTDEIWQLLAIKGVHTGENRAIGAIVQAGVRSGMITHTERWRPTRRRIAHKRPVAIYRSNICKE